MTTKTAVSHDDAVIRRLRKNTKFAAEYLTEAATGERTAEGEAEAQAEVDAANAAMQAVVDSWVRVREVIGTLTPDQAARETRDIRAASERATAAEGELHRVRATNRGHELLGELTIRTFAEAPAEERRRYMSLMYRAVVCRPAARWREPVTDRYVILRTVSQAPTYGVPLIREVIELGK